MTIRPYCSASGRNLIYEYIDSLSTEEQVDGYTVLQHMEKGEFDKIFFKPWEKKIYICFMPVRNRRTKLRRRMRILFENVRKN